MSTAKQSVLRATEPYTNGPLVPWTGAKIGTKIKRTRSFGRDVPLL
jgi:hypothetical protein